MNKKQITLFTILLFLIPCFCRYFDNESGGVYDNPNLSMYIWGISPIFMTLVFRTYNKDWKGLDIELHFRKNWKWYIFAVALYPVTCSIQILISQLVGSLEMTENFSISQIITSIFSGFGLIFLKNISEEFTWRGYLTYSFDEKGMSRIKNHFIVSIIWSIWHIPFIGRGISFNSGNNFWASFIMWMIFGFIVSIIYGEIRLRIKTVWPIVLLHTFGNLVLPSALSYEMVNVFQKYTYLVGVHQENLLSMTLFSIIAWIIYRKNTD